MNDLYLLFCLISLFVGIAAISIALFVYQSHKIKAFFYYIGLNFSFFLIQNSILLNTYTRIIANPSGLMIGVKTVVDIVGSSCCSFFGLFLVNYLFGLEVGKFKKIIIISICSVQLILGIIFYTFNLKFIIMFILSPSSIMIILYELFIIFKNYRNIKNEVLKNGIKKLGILTILFVPLITLEYYRSEINFLANIFLIKMLAMPSYFLILNLFSIDLSLRYFNVSSFVEENKSTKYLTQDFGITEKESQVVELVIKGLTYKQISEELNIAYKTVDNHVQNIYKKLGVSSKVQLLNFIRGNEK